MNNKKQNRMPRNGQPNPTLNTNDRFMLIPQNNKYINVYHNYTHPVPQLQPKDKMEMRKVHKVIVRKPTVEERHGCEGDSPDQFMNQLIGSLFSGLNGGGGVDMIANKMLDNKPVKNEPVEPIVQTIDRDKLVFIEERPKTLEDLLDLAKQIDTKYPIDKYYNIDLNRLRTVEPALQKLHRMVGLVDVKNKIVDIILYYLQRLDVKNQDMLHTIIDGAPGSGKTEIAHIYSDILRGLGVLSKGTFKKAKKHDLIGGYLGHTAMKTMKLLEEIKGGVLFIDEIYSLGSSAGKESKDIYAKECVDLLMEFMSENKSDFVLVVAGYKEDIERFFLSMNDGLERRFPIHLSIGEYGEEELRQIFLKKVNELKWDIEDDAIPSGFFKDNKDYFKYYGGDMETLLSKCKYSHSRNLVEDHSKIHRVISRRDFVDGFELYRKNPEIEKRKETPKYLSFYT